MTAKKSVILWASYFDELAAISIVHTFRQLGIPTELVAIHQREEKQRSDVLTHSHKTLDETVATVKQIACLIIPSSVTVLGHFEQDPLFWQLIHSVDAQGGRVVMCQPDGPADPEIAKQLPAPERMIFLPVADKLLVFARWLGQGLLAGDGLNHLYPRRGMPPLIRVANESNPASVAGAMAGIIRDYGFAEAQSVGAAAGNQMLKAAAIAKSYLVADRLALSITPDFVTVRIGGFPRSAIHLFIRARPTEMDNRMDWTEVPAPAPTKDD